MKIRFLIQTRLILKGVLGKYGLKNSRSMEQKDFFICQFIISEQVYLNRTMLFITVNASKSSHSLRLMLYHDFTVAQHVSRLPDAVNISAIGCR